MKLNLTALVILSVITLCAGLYVLSSCHTGKVRIDYGGMKHVFSNALDEYASHSHVVLKTNLSLPNLEFWLNDQKLDVCCHEGKGYEIVFQMPDYDTVLTVGNESSIVVANYYETSTGTLNKSSFELVLKASTKTQPMHMDVYVKEENEETCTQSAVSDSLLDKCIELCRKYRIEQWNELSDSVSLDGKRCVFACYDSGKWIRVSSDQMIHEGMEFFDQIKALMSDERE